MITRLRLFLARWLLGATRLWPEHPTHHVHRDPPGRKAAPPQAGTFLVAGGATTSAILATDTVVAVDP